MLTTKQKEEFILANGWEKYGKYSYVKTEWLNESETLGLPSHLCPNWYHVETLDAAYQSTIKSIEIDTEMKEELLKNGWEIKDNGFVKINWIDKSHPMKLNAAYLMLQDDLTVKN